MKCSNAQKRINEYIDNLLNAGQARRLENHLDKCSDCRGFLADMKSIVANARTLDTLNPSDDLWPAIKREVLKKNRQSYMQQKKPFRTFPLYFKRPLFAFSTLVALLIVMPLLYYHLSDMPNKNGDPMKTALMNITMAEQHYQSAIEALGQVIETRAANLDPELMSVFKQNLAIIDDSIRLCKESIKKTPESRETGRLLLICYRKKVELLNEIKSMTMQI